MKRNTYVIIAVVIIAGIALTAYLLRPLSPSKKTSISNGDLEVKISYSRPYKKGRLIFGEASDGALVPNGEYWRLGANKATEITFSKDVKFADKGVKAGTYRMYAVPGDKTWEVTLNGQLGKSGSETPDPAFDILTIETQASSNAEETEQFTIDLEKASTGVTMKFVWDHLTISIPIGPDSV